MALNLSISLMTYFNQVGEIPFRETQKELILIRRRYLLESYSVIFLDKSLTSIPEISLTVQTLLQTSPSIVLDLKEKLTFMTKITPTPLHFIFLIRNNALKGFILQLRMNKLWHARSRVLIFVEEENQVRGCLTLMWEITKAVEVVVRVLNSNNYYTWFPYLENECSEVVTVQKLINTNLFPMKISKNFHQCSINVVTEQVMPFSILPDKGVDQLLIITLAQVMNFTRVIMKSEEFFWSIYNSEGNPAGFAKVLSENKADIAIATIQRRMEITNFADMTRSHIEDHLSWFVSLPKFIPSVEKLQRAFSIRMWVYVATSYVAVTVAAGIIKVSSADEKHSLGQVVLFVLLAYLNVATKMPTHHILRFLMVVLFLYSVHITTIYQSALIYMLSNKVSEPAIRHVLDALDKNFEFYFFEVHRALLNNSDSSLWRELERKKNYVFARAPPFGEWHGNVGEKVFIGPLVAIPYHLKFLQLTDEENRVPFSALKEYFMTLPTVVCTPLGHPIQPVIDDFIQRLLEGGLVDWWFSKFLGKPSSPLGRINKPLTIDALVGAFLMYQVGLAFSLVFFLLENGRRFQLCRTNFDEKERRRTVLDRLNKTF